MLPADERVGVHGRVVKRTTVLRSGAHAQPIADAERHLADRAWRGGAQRLDNLGLIQPGERDRRVPMLERPPQSAAIAARPDDASVEMSRARRSPARASAMKTTTMARPGIRALATKGTYRRRIAGSFSPVSNPPIRENRSKSPESEDQRDDAPHAKLPGCRLASHDARAGQQHRDNSQPADRLNSIEARRRVRSPRERQPWMKWRTQQWREKVHTARALRHCAAGVTYSPRAISCAACQRSGAAPTTKVPPIARAVAAAWRTRADGIGVRVTAGLHTHSAYNAAQIQIPVSVFCGRCAETATLPSVRSRPPVTAIQTATAPSRNTIATSPRRVHRTVVVCALLDQRISGHSSHTIR